ncbi:hypothetical protein INT45_001611 [Circinella minor]|uniref:Uncharacterized protein n=1 Tax=Circinella minor TaxID=1195481 RepID=A0A8H7RRA8_9FUNG|nr:hypothetical protein INT45_001611 [Circinella minor]
MNTKQQTIGSDGMSFHTLLGQLYGRETMFIKALFDVLSNVPQNELSPYCAEVLECLKKEHQEGKFCAEMSAFIDEKLVAQENLKQMIYNDLQRQIDDKNEEIRFKKDMEKAVTAVKRKVYMEEKEELEEQLQDWHTTANEAMMEVCAEEYMIEHRTIIKLLEEKLDNCNRELSMFIVSGRTYRAHQNAAIINEATIGAPSVESDDGDARMGIDNNYYDAVNDNNVADYDYGYDEDYNDEGEYADVNGLLPEQFDPCEDEEHNVDSDEEIPPAIDIEFDGTIVDDHEAHEINISTSSPLDHLQHPLIYIFVFLVLFQINHISERIANTLISVISVLIGSFASEKIRQCIPHSIAGMKKWIGLDYLTEDLQMYSACPTCHAIYPLPGPQNCTNPSRRMNGTLCDTPLLKLIASSNNRGNPYPLEDSLKRLFMRENFEEKIEQ